MATFINLGIFQIFWVGLVLAGEWFIIPVCCWWVVHFRVYASAFERMLLPIFTIAGITMDQLFILLGLFQFNQISSALPLWMIGLWILFPTTLFHGLRWIWSKSTWILFASAGGASLNYVLGEKITSLTLPLSLQITAPTLIIAWSCYLLMVRRLSQSEKVHAT